MFDQPFVILIFIGLGLTAAGFLVREELLLRVLVLAGTVFDVAFYYLQAPPIWGSVLTNSILFFVNAALICIIVVERSTWFMTDKERLAFTRFKTLSPGQFRRVNRLARWDEAAEDTELLHEGETSEKLFFIEAERFTVTKRGRSYSAQGPAFAGEIMLLQGGAATATVTVPKGAVYAEWRSGDLRRAMRKSQPLENALVARFGHDLADKVRHSVPLAAFGPDEGGPPHPGT